MANFGVLYSNSRLIKLFLRITPTLLFKRSIYSTPYNLKFQVKHASHRKVHISRNLGLEKRNASVSHLAVQELAMSAFRRLKLEVSKFQRAKKSDIEAILKGNLKNLIIDEKEIVFLIRCCGSLLRSESVTTRNNLIDILWRNICDSGLSLTSHHFTALLETYIENLRHVSPQKFLNYMKHLKIEPSRETLIKLLKCSRSDMGPKHTMNNLVEIVEELKSRGYSADVEMFEALSSTLAESGDLSGAEDIVETMKKAQLEPTASVYTSLMKEYIRLEDIPSIKKIINEMENRNLSMLESQYVSVIEKFAEAAHISERKGSQFAKEISNLLPQIGTSEGISILHCIANAVLSLVNEKKENIALSLILHLPPKLLSGHQFLEPLPVLFSKEVVKADCDAEVVINICDQLESLTVPLIRKEGFLEPYLLHAVLGLSLHLGKRKLSYLLLKALYLHGAIIRPHYFWPIFCMIAKKDAASDENDFLMLLREMTEMGVEADYDTLCHYVLPFLDKKHSALDILSILKEFGSTGIVPRTTLTGHLISIGDLRQATNFNAVHHGKINSELVIEPLVGYIVEDFKKPNRLTFPDMVRLLKLMQAKGDKGVDYTGLFLLEFCERLGFMSNGKESEFMDRDLDYILSLLKFLDSRNMRISPEAEDALLYFLQPKLELREIESDTRLYVPRVDSSLFLSKADKLLNRIPHPREMTLSELELHLVELRSKSLNERGVLRRLLQIYCRLGNLNKALEIKQALESQGHSFSAGMLSSLLDLYLKHNMLNESEKMYLQIRKYHPKFRLDDHKVLDLATLLCKCGRITDSMEILEQHSQSLHVRPGQAVEKNVLLFLKSVHLSLGRGSTKETEEPKGKASGPAVAFRNDKIGNLTVKKILLRLIDLGYIADPPPKSLTDFTRGT